MVRYVKTPQPKEADWDAINKREFFCKAVNSILMTNPDMDLDIILAMSKRIVDKAFENYPDSQPQEEELEEPL